MEDVVLMIDRHFADKINAEIEAAFAVANVTEQRVFPKTYTPTPKDKLPVPWYVAPFQNESGPSSELP